MSAAFLSFGNSCVSHSGRIGAPSVAHRVADAHPDCAVYQSPLERIVKDMVRIGEIERVPTGGRGSQPKWQYRLPAMSPEVAALERALPCPRGFAVFTVM